MNWQKVGRWKRFCGLVKDMPRPKNKSELEQLSSENFERLKNLLGNCSKEQLRHKFPLRYLNRNVRDVLGHLHHWQLMFFDWYSVGMKGEKPEMPAKGFTWKMTPELNKFIQNQYCNTDVDEMLRRLIESHEKLKSIIIKHTNEELFEKKKYAWTGSTSLSQYLVSATSSHYVWAMRLIKKCLDIKSAAMEKH